MCRVSAWGGVPSPADRMLCCVSSSKRASSPPVPDVMPRSSCYGAARRPASSWTSARRRPSTSISMQKAYICLSRRIEGSTEGRLLLMFARVSHTPVSHIVACLNTGDTLTGSCRLRVWSVLHLLGGVWQFELTHGQLGEAPKLVCRSLVHHGCS
jgi:hypothetical protein